MSYDSYAAFRQRVFEDRERSLAKKAAEADRLRKEREAAERHARYARLKWEYELEQERDRQQRLRDALIEQEAIKAKAQPYNDAMQAQDIMDSITGGKSDD